jgi:hypothetical protein
MTTYLKQNRDLIFKKFNNDELLNDCLNYVSGTGKLNKILNHYFEELIFESCGRTSKISPMQVLHDDVKIEEIFKYIDTKPKFYTGSDVQNLKSYFRNAVSWVRKVANFCPKQARLIQNRYNPDGITINVLDTSAGFGSRMSSALLSGNNYCGIDPNKKLQVKLKELSDFYTDSGLCKNKPYLICGGSEVLYKELVNRFDVSFTSPPYFNLEYYSDDDSESTKNYDNYSNWVSNYVIPTVQNTYEYLKVGGIAMINIKNINKKTPLFDDFYTAFSNIEGFDFVEVFDMKIQSKKNYGMATGGDISQVEPVMVFRKVK